MPDLHDLSPLAAYARLETTPYSVLIDIRSAMEYLFVGHPVGSVHIPWIDEPDWEENPNFAKDVQHLLQSRFKEITPQQDASVILICRSGKRSQEAATALLAAGFQHVMHVDEGFEGERDDNHHRGTLGGWRFHGLPWEQC
ncbi:rhodanese-like domain-containing protein [Thiothrix lacustris]|jgi:rhodanese-related sulfurtransferase|uniref:Rhodanese-like domain-containing protein n=1 Tax=Thiothrix lacustris TaxID=525917 RepID=A0ABY9MRK8_9GAMM|nr:rhodanese-like domain-containing protein [Thiothrix lacustris]WML91301.1 rhodanese-like domain-containing protein [Thiothrix lacustris]WMP18156.1 rhodanese-like domain-containing protein [Thiothrix lacustris]